MKTFIFIGLFLNFQAQALDLKKFHCSRQDSFEGKDFASEITFNDKVTAESAALEGMLANFCIENEKKVYISGLSFYAITFEAGVINGLTGDEKTLQDGSFTLFKLGKKFNNKWKFVWTGTKEEKLEAEFECVYDCTGIDCIDDPTKIGTDDQPSPPSDIPSR